MDEDIQSSHAKSFRGKLYMRSGGRNIPLRLSRSSDNPTWGTPEEDWLQVGGREDSPTVDFHFDSQTEDRLHYHLCIPWYPRTKKLGVSRNGYLGFYWNAEVTDFWKIEPLHMTEEGLVCYLRDHRGHRVGAMHNDQHYNGDGIAFLNVDQGVVAPFLLKQIG
jgi:hypothetical protein